MLFMHVLAVANFKGGTGKTVAAGWVAHALAESGLDVYVADADPQGSITLWGAHADWTVPVAGLAVNNLHTRLAGIAGPRDVVVIDTPPLEDHRAIVTSALRAATHVLIPIGPYPVEYVQLPKMADLLADLEPLRTTPPAVGVLLVRVRAGTAGYPTHRDAIAADGWRVLSAHVPMWERYAQSYGGPITGAGGSPYADAAAELLAGEGTQ